MKRKIKIIVAIFLCFYILFAYGCKLETKQYTIKQLTNQLQSVELAQYSEYYYKEIGACAYHKVYVLSEEEIEYILPLLIGDYAFVPEPSFYNEYDYCIKFVYKSYDVCFFVNSIEDPSINFTNSYSNVENRTKAIEYCIEKYNNAKRGDVSNE